MTNDHQLMIVTWHHNKFYGGGLKSLRENENYLIFQNKPFLFFAVDSF